MEPHELEARAAALRALAAEVQDVVDAPLRRAEEPVWRCAHAETVRGALRAQRTAARASAEHLRTHAHRLDVEAARIREERAAAARRAAQEAQDRKDAAARAAKADAKG